MITYTEKGKWMHDAISDAGHSLHQVENGDWISSNDIAVQAIVDSFDPLPFAKAEKIKQLKIEGLRRVNLVYDSDGIDEVFPSVGHFKMLLDIENTYDRSGAVAPRLLEVNNNLTAYENALSAINAGVDWQVVMSYDVVGTPLWP